MDAALLLAQNDTAPQTNWSVSSGDEWVPQAVPRISSFARLRHWSKRPVRTPNDVRLLGYFLVVPRIAPRFFPWIPFTVRLAHPLNYHAIVSTMLTGRQAETARQAERTTDSRGGDGLTGVRRTVQIFTCRTSSRARRASRRGRARVS